MVDLKEPLLRCPEYQRILTSPAVWVAVSILMRSQERAIFTQALDDAWVSLEDIFSSPLHGFGGKASLIVDRGIRAQAILRAHHKVLVAVARGGMHQARAGFRRHMVAIHQLYVARNERVAKDIAPVELSQRIAVEWYGSLDIEVAFFCDRFGQLVSNNVVAVARLERGIVKGGIEANAEVRRQRPRRCCPDYRE